VVAAAGFVAGILITALTLALLAPHLPHRPNFRGRPIPTATGLALLPIILISVLLALAFGWGGAVLAFLGYALVAALVGYVDDVYGGSAARGFGGHFRALARGRVTTGLLKVAVLGGGAVIFCVVAVNGGIFSVIIASVLMAGSVNLANLLDVRPARTLKFLGIPAILLLFAVPEEVRAAALPVLGGAAALFLPDLRGRVMLGDSGAAVVGAVVGFLVVMSGSGVLWAGALALIAALTVLAEVSSISGLIDRVGVLKRLDRWGRID
jgi:UDP-GlcNAc:undecaprenyl-phosphate GlcNAc-1-phosphate transferase